MLLVLSIVFCFCSVVLWFVFLSFIIVLLQILSGIAQICFLICFSIILFCDFLSFCCRFSIVLLQICLIHAPHTHPTRQTRQTRQTRKTRKTRKTRSTLLTYQYSSLANTTASQYKISESIQQQANTAQQSTPFLQPDLHNPPLHTQ